MCSLPASFLTHASVHKFIGCNSWPASTEEESSLSDTFCLGKHTDAFELHKTLVNETEHKRRSVIFE